MSDEQNINPQNNSYLIGQQEAEEIFLRAWKNNSMHHAWILGGEKGIGKATLAYRIARFLFWADKSKSETYNSLNVPEGSSIFKQVSNNSYPDIMVLERDYIETDRKKLMKAIQKGEALDNEELSLLKKSAYIRVDDVRKVNEFLSKTSFNDGWRVVIIDSADDMNKNSANALLKILEEPPAKTMILLISHNPGILLPTIRSRCAKLPMRLLSSDDVSSLLRRYRPNINENMIAKLAEMSEGSIGKAILYSDNEAVTKYEELCGLLYSQNNFSLQKLLDFSNKMSADNESFSLLQELIIKFLKENMPNCRNVETLYNCWNETNKMFADCINVNMDKRLTLINLLTKICKAI